MRQQSDAAVFFNGFAQNFDTIYDQKRNVVMRWIDCQFRSDMFARYSLTFAKLGELSKKTVIDIGCGSGPYVIEALRRGASMVTAMDPAANMLALTQQRLLAHGWEGRCVLRQDAFPSNHVEKHDHAIVMGVLDYVRDATEFMNALKPIVRESAVISFPSKHWFRTPFRKVRYSLRRCPVYFYDRREIVTLCQDAGFTGIEVTKIPGAGMDYHVCVRP